jgi:hypothetical protein
MGSRSIGGSRVKKHAVSSDTKETTLRSQRPRLWNAVYFIIFTYVPTDLTSILFT